MDLWLIKTVDGKQQTRKRRRRLPRSHLRATRKQGSEVGARRRLNKVSVPSRWGGGVIAHSYMSAAVTSSSKSPNLPEMNSSLPQEPLIRAAKIRHLGPPGSCPTTKQAPTWMRCRVSTATGWLAFMLSVNQVMLTTCMLGRSSGARSFSHAHSTEAWLLSDTTWVTLLLRGKRAESRHFSQRLTKIPSFLRLLWWWAEQWTRHRAPEGAGKGLPGAKTLAADPSGPPEVGCSLFSTSHRNH